MDVLVQLADLMLRFTVINRTFNLIFQFALQPFQLTLQIYEKARALYQFSITHRQEINQPNVNADWLSVWLNVWYRHVRLQYQLSVPPRRRCAYYPHLLDYKAIRNWTMQSDCYGTNQRPA